MPLQIIQNLLRPPQNAIDILSAFGYILTAVTIVSRIGNEGVALSRKGKIWITVLAIPVILVITGIVIATLYFTSDRLRALIIPRIEEETHRTVVVRNASLSFFPSFGVVVEGLAVSNPRGKSFDRAEFLSLEKLVLDVKILPLLKRQLEISRISLFHPRLYLERSADGTRNYSTRTGSVPRKSGNETAPAQPASRSRLSILLANFEIHDGEIDYVDKKYDARMLMAGYYQTARAEAALGESIIRFETKDRKSVV